MSECPKVPLLEADPQLGRLLPAHRLDAARALAVCVARVPQGEWRIGENGASEHLGVLVLEGVAGAAAGARASTAAARRRAGAAPCWWSRSSARRGRWHVLSECRVALLDRRLSWQLGGWPEVRR